MFTIFLSFSFAKKNLLLLIQSFPVRMKTNKKRKEREKSKSNIKESLKKVPKALSVKRESCKLFTEF